MNKLERYQAYAEKCAVKLGVTDKIVLRWSSEPCKTSKNTLAHCHIKYTEFPRGTICLARDFASAYFNPVKKWHQTVAHEVAHLAVKSAHGTPTFDRRLVALGVANLRERRNAKSTRNHRHEWGSGQSDRLGHFKYCHICRKIETQGEEIRK